ncbi:putative bel15-i ag [Aphis craccivora]|uniref:Putative bel15-i ag n=1 Tax=Aphis craccivora TaxID=307492 RepID=A0A6G0YG99_APHCR|nr:putative bel15-i ag [Aphis craccivora]
MKRHRSSNRWRQQLRTIYPPGSSCVSDIITIVKWSELGGHIHELCSMPSITKVSSAILRRHQNGMNSLLRALTALKLPVEHWDAIIIHLMVEKLDVESHRLWESSRSCASLPSIQEYLAFLNQRYLILESIETRSNYATDKSASSCTLCSGQHATYACQGFLRMTVNERKEHVRSKRLCYNCLRPDHMSRICSRGSCKTFRGKHHILLHIMASTEVQMATATDAIESQQ